MKKAKKYAKAALKGFEDCCAEKKITGTYDQWISEFEAMAEKIIQDHSLWGRIKRLLLFWK